jgi:hypothetical protein
MMVMEKLIGRSTMLSIIKAENGKRRNNYV